jgi:putative two-component system response regulator
LLPERRGSLKSGGLQTDTIASEGRNGNVLHNPRLTDARILIVDDERVNVVLLERILEQDGYHNIKSVTDPSAVAALYDEFEPDLVMLDLHMPKLDGFAVMKLLEDRISTGAFLPILILTADIRPEIKRRALSAGAKDFVTKPFDRGEVLLRIQNLLEARFLHLRVRHDQIPEEQGT